MNLHACLTRTPIMALLALASLLGCGAEVPGIGERGAEGGVAVEVGLRDGSAGNVGAPEPGRLVIVGGALDADNVAVYAAVLEGRSGDGPLCVIPTASSEPEESMAGMVADLDRHGGGGTAQGIPLPRDAPERARDPSVAAELQGCSGFYFTGGSQSRILDVFLPAGDTTAAYRAVRERWLEGAVVAGSSAGAAMMSSVMIAGGSSEEALRHGVTRSAEAEGVQLRAGMGFFEPIVDQHFLARGRIGRLVVAVTDPQSPGVGLGIDENTALVVDGATGSVVGASGVVVVDGREASVPAPGRPSGVRIELAGRGDVIDLRSLAVRREGQKEELELDDPPFVPGEDPFARWAFLETLDGLASTSASAAVFEVAGVALTIEESDGFSAAAHAPSGGVEDTPSGFSAGPFRVALRDLADPDEREE